jgi:hypothetical protein
MSNNKDKLRAWKAQNPPAPVPDRNKMVAALKAEVVPQLRKNGFSGSFPHFRRIGPTKTDCVTFQFDKWGGGFVVEIGEGPTDTDGRTDISLGRADTGQEADGA